MDNELYMDDENFEEELECPMCGSANLHSEDGIYYDDDECLGFKYQCEECGEYFYN